MSDVELRHQQTRTFICLVCGNDCSLPGFSSLFQTKYPSKCAYCAFTYADGGSFHISNVPGALLEYWQLPSLERATVEPQSWLDRIVNWWRLAFHLVKPWEIVNEHGPELGLVVDIGYGGDQRGSISPRFNLVSLEPAVVSSLEIAADAQTAGSSVIKTSAADGLSQFADRSLAGVVLHTELEHEHHAFSVMRLLSKKLRYDGLAVVKLANYDFLNQRTARRSWYDFTHGVHTCLSRKREIECLASRCYMQAIFPFPFSLPTNDHFITILRPLEMY